MRHLTDGKWRGLAWHRWIEREGGTGAISPAGPQGLPQRQGQLSKNQDQELLLDPEGIQRQQAKSRAECLRAQGGEFVTCCWGRAGVGAPGFKLSLKLGGRPCTCGEGEHPQVQALWRVGASKWLFLSLFKELSKWKWWCPEIDNRSVRTVKVLTIKMKGFQARPSLHSTTASRGTPKQGPSSSPPPKMSSSPRGSTPRSAHRTPLSLNSPFLQGPFFNDSSLNSPFLQGPSLNEIENCLTGLSAEEMEQVGD